MKKSGNQLLREAARQSNRGKLPKPPKGSYDVRSAYLRGKAGGEAHPNYIPGGGKAKR